MNTFYVLPEVSRMKTFQDNDDAFRENVKAIGHQLAAKDAQIKEYATCVIAIDKRINELKREVERLRNFFKAPATECSICRGVHGREITHEAE